VRDVEGLTFAASADGIPTSRRWVVEQARRAGCTEESVRTIALLTTEAVANAVKHGPDGGEVTLTLSVVPGGLRVAVTDESPGLPVASKARPSALGGRGVMLIDRLASAWGVEGHSAAGKTVWFQVDLPSGD
jgi:serine/threonine-protein kinase RsbW